MAIETKSGLHKNGCRLADVDEYSTHKQVEDPEDLERFADCPHCPDT